MLATIRSAVSRRRARLAAHRRRAAAYRRLAGEPLENRLLLSVDSWVLPTGLPSGSRGQREVDTDALGNIYMAASIDGGTETSLDMILAKYSPGGDLLWQHHFPFLEDQYCWGAAAAADGFYVVGQFMGLVDFDPTEDGETILQSSVNYGGTDGFLAKYSLDGALLWVRQFGNEWSRLYGVVVQQDDVYVTGVTLLQQPSGKEYNRAMLAKVSSNNDLMWVEDIGSGTACGLAVHKPEGGATRIYVTGSGNTTVPSDLPRYFVAGVLESADGTGADVEWVRDLGDDFGYIPVRMAVTTEVVDGVVEPCIYVLGDLYGRLLKLNQYGTNMWSQKVVSDRVSLRDVAVYENVVYVVGSFGGSADFDPDNAAPLIVSRGDDDSFLARYDTRDGHLMGVQRLGGTNFDHLSGLAVADGYICATGLASPVHADFPASQLGQISAFLPVMTNELYVMRLDAAAPVVNIAEPTITVREGEPVTLSATTSAGTITWYESGVPLAVDAEGKMTLGVGTHLISAIATDDVGRIGMAGVVVNVINSETYASTDTPKPMADAHPSKGPGLTTSQITVPSGMAIGTLKVDLSIAHSAPSQLEARLVGKSLAGTWTLRLYDHVRGTTGTLNSWSITASPFVVENLPPVANDDSYSVAEDATLTIVAPGVLGNDSDADVDPLTAQLVSNVNFGTLALNADGSFSYTPSADFNGSDSFTYRAFDGTDYSSAATVTITINPVNDAPVADDQSVASKVNTPLDITLSASDVELDPLSYSVVAAPAHGSLSGTAPNLVYTPNTGYTGSDSFTFQAHDGSDSSNVATVTIDIAANHVPVADPQSVLLNEDSAAAITLTGSDADLDPLSFLIIDQPQHGTLTGKAPDVVYMPLANYFGSDSFTFLVSDGTDNSLPATVSLTIQPVNDPPVADSQSLATDEDTSLAVTLTGSDLENDPLTFQIVSGPSHGTLSGTAPNLLYTPASDYNGSDSFTFVAHDGVANSVPATISLQINPVNDAPVAMDDAASTYQDTAVTVPVLANDADVDGDTLTVTNVTDLRNGSVTLNADNTITYTPDPGFIGTDTFSYTITDGELTSTATVSIEVTETPSNVIYVYDIRFESKRGNKDWRAVFEIRSDSNGSGGGDEGDAPIAGVAISVKFADQTYSGTTGADGVFRTDWIMNLSSGTHYANVVDLAMASYYWALWMDLEDDSDNDGNPDDVLVR